MLNFYAGPTALPWPVIERMREDIVDFHGTRMGVMEISHRAPEIDGLLADTAARVRRLLGLSGEFEVLFLQGGGSLQFSMVPMNFSAPGEPVDYVDTGYWARKSIAEPERMGRDVAVVASSAGRSDRYVPPASAIKARPGARYLHIVTNNTVEGTQFRELPRTGVPLIADASSDLMTDRRRGPLLPALAAPRPRVLIVKTFTTYSPSRMDKIGQNSLKGLQLGPKAGVIVSQCKTVALSAALAAMREASRLRLAGI